LLREQFQVARRSGLIVAVRFETGVRGYYEAIQIVGASHYTLALLGREASDECQGGAALGQSVRRRRSRAPHLHKARQNSKLEYCSFGLKKQKNGFIQNVVNNA
jgi:hypothetical protein